MRFGRRQGFLGHRSWAGSLAHVLVGLCQRNSLCRTSLAHVRASPFLFALIPSVPPSAHPSNSLAYFRAEFLIPRVFTTLKRCRITSLLVCWKEGGCLVAPLTRSLIHRRSRCGQMILINIVSAGLDSSWCHSAPSAHLATRWLTQTSWVCCYIALAGLCEYRCRYVREQAVRQIS